MLFWHYISGLRAAGFEVLSVVLAQPDNSTPDSLSEYEALARNEGIEVAVCRADSFLEERRHAVRLREDSLGPALGPSPLSGPMRRSASTSSPAGRRAGRPAPRVVWLGDLRFQTVWYHALYEAKERRAATLELPLAMVRSRAWRRAYRRALEGAAAVIVSSKSSEAQLQRLGIASEYQPYPWPAEPAGAAGRLPENPTFLFLGTLQALGSRSAFHFILHELYPELVQRWGSGGFRIVIAGRGEVPGWAATMLATTPELEHVGFVDDLAGLLGSVHAAIAPISVPVGNRSRILTALAAGAVVVAHRTPRSGTRTWWTASRASSRPMRRRLRSGWRGPSTIRPGARRSPPAARSSTRAGSGPTSRSERQSIRLRPC